MLIIISGYISTCPSGSANKLSEAVLSRFTVISVSEYTPEEKELVIENYIQLNALNNITQKNKETIINYVH